MLHAKFLQFDDKITLLHMLFHTSFHYLHQVWDLGGWGYILSQKKGFIKQCIQLQKFCLHFKTQNTYFLTAKPCRHTLLGRNYVPQYQLSSGLQHTVFWNGNLLSPPHKMSYYFCVLCNISLHTVRDFYVWSYVFKRSVYILYHAPHICTRMNKLEISFHVFKAGVNKMMNFRVTKFFSRGCFILHGVKIQGTIIWRNL